MMGRFRCEERLAADGPLETYRARVQGLGGFDRVFSLTCLMPGALARRPNAAESLLRAARTAMTVKDARVAMISESGLAPGSAFVASEFVHGVSLLELAEHLSSSTSPRSLPPAVWGGIIASIGAEIAGVLAVAHAAATPVIHGALAPSNVMVTPQGAVKLLDFGLLSAVAPPIEITLMPGRAHLMAPELRPGSAPAGQPGAVPWEKPADLFALGAMLDKLAAIEAPEGPPGMAGFPTARPMPLSLRPLLRALTVPAAGQRPGAAEAEASFRQIVRESRGIDVALELGTLVRLIMQLRPPADAAPASASSSGSMPRISLSPPGGFSPGGHLGQVPDQPFADEPTAILDVSGDGKPSSLAAILLEMRATDAEEEAAHETPTNIPVATFSQLAASNAATRAAAAAGGGEVAAPISAFESVKTRMASVPQSLLQAGLTPALGINVGPPPSPDEAVMDAAMTAAVDAVVEAASDLARPNAAVPVTAPAIRTGGDATEATMVSTQAPSLEELLAPPSDPAGLPFFTDDGEEGHHDNAPRAELRNLTSGEIAASLPDPRRFHPAGTPMPAPPQGAAIDSTTERDHQAPMMADGAPEPIKFAEFSAALPVSREAHGRGAFTPPNWRPGNVDGPPRGQPPGSGDSGTPEPVANRPRFLPVALAAVAIISAIAIALLSR
jgi:serine/threonine protein kinase